MAQQDSTPPASNGLDSRTKTLDMEVLDNLREQHTKLHHQLHPLSSSSPASPSAAVAAVSYQCQIATVLGRRPSGMVCPGGIPVCYKKHRTPNDKVSPRDRHTGAGICGRGEGYDFGITTVEAL